MRRLRLTTHLFLGVIFVLALTGLRAEDGGALGDQVRALADENHRLREQLDAQQKQLDALAAKLGAMEKSGEQQTREIRQLRDREPAADEPAVLPTRTGPELRLSGEAGIAFFHTGSAGAFPNSEFRVDDTKVFLEAPVLKDVYFFGEIDLRLRESGDGSLGLGEVYVDLENVSGRFGGPADLVSVRAGQLYVPFGEEYLARSAVANPLISHSLADVWGVDTGLEIYGASGPWQYVVAVQNGGSDPVRDYNADKAVTARLGWTLAPWLHVSASALRTGELKVGNAVAPGDFISALWFGNGFFRSISSATTFWVNMWEGDATARWHGGHVSAAFGGVRYDDNNPAADDSRQLRYGFLEAVQNLGENFFGATRFSEIRAPASYPIVGWGAGRYFFSPSLTEELKRWSVGLGYRFGPPLVLKVEYAWEWGHQVGGGSRDQENFFGTEIGLKF